MQAACLQENAAHAMNLLGRSIYSRGNDNMSRHVLIAAENGAMKFTASSGHTYITATIGSMIDQPGRVTLPGRLFHDYVNSLPAERLEFAADPENPLTLKVNCGQREWSRILGADPQYFPATPKVSPDYKVEIDPEVFQDTLRRTLFSAAKEDTRPVLATVCLAFSPEGLRAASADGFRLSVRACPLETPPEQEFQLLVPAKDLEEAARLAQYQQNPLSIVADADLKWVEFRTQAATLVTQLFKGQFPNYDGLIPTEWNTRATFSRSSLQMHVNATATMALRDNSILRFNVEGADSMLRVRAQSTETGDAVGEMNADIEGADNRIAFNAKYVQEILNRVDVDQLTVAFKDGSSPGVFRPADSADNYVHVVMPMFVQWDEPAPASPEARSEAPADADPDFANSEVEEQPDSSSQTEEQPEAECPPEANPATEPEDEEPIPF